VNWTNCKYCQGAGCLVCGSTKQQRLEREAAVEEARRFLRDYAKQLGVDEYRINPDTIPLVAEAIRYGRESTARKLVEEHAAAAPDRFEMLEIGETT
jgi:hypothetical protein